jgi:hypothetical protein
LCRGGLFFFLLLLLLLLLLPSPASLSPSYLHIRISWLQSRKCFFFPLHFPALVFLVLMRSLVVVVVVFFFPLFVVVAEYVRAAMMCARFLCACCDSNVFRVCIINWWIFFLSVFFLVCCRVFLGSLSFDYAHARTFETSTLKCPCAQRRLGLFLFERFCCSPVW